jgi:predicted RNase H-like HicB family nuclease
MEYVYPAIFHENKDKSYTISYPDLPGCISEGKSLGNALSMAQSALVQWLGYLNDKNQKLPEASDINDMSIKKDEFVNLVRVELKDKLAIKRTVSIPKWMDDKVSQSGLSLSKVLQEALAERLA